MSTTFVQCNIIGFFLLALAPFAGAQDAETGALTVIVDGARSPEGDFRIAVCADDPCYQNNGPFVVKADKPAALAPVTFILPNLPLGDYAVVMHHDEDGDRRFDKFLMVPLEGFGFSNDAKPVFGRPPFSAVAVTLTADGAIAPITVQY